MTQRPRIPRDYTSPRSVVIAPSATPLTLLLSLCCYCLLIWFCSMLMRVLKFFIVTWLFYVLIFVFVKFLINMFPHMFIGIWWFNMWWYEQVGSGILLSNLKILWVPALCFATHLKLPLYSGRKLDISFWEKHFYSEFQIVPAIVTRPKFTLVEPLIGLQFDFLISWAHWMHEPKGANILSEDHLF